MMQWTLTYLINVNEFVDSTPIDQNNLFENSWFRKFNIRVRRQLSNRLMSHFYKMSVQCALYWKLMWKIHLFIVNLFIDVIKSVLTNYSCIISFDDNENNFVFERKAKKSRSQASRLVYTDFIFIKLLYCIHPWY